MQTERSWLVVTVTLNQIPAVSEGENLTIDDLQSERISLCWRDQYEQKDLI